MVSRKMWIGSSGCGNRNLGPMELTVSVCRALRSFSSAATRALDVAGVRPLPSMRIGIANDTGLAREALRRVVCRHAGQ